MENSPYTAKGDTNPAANTFTDLSAQCPEQSFDIAPTHVRRDGASQDAPQRLQMATREFHDIYFRYQNEAIGARYLRNALYELRKANALVQFGAKRLLEPGFCGERFAISNGKICQINPVLDTEQMNRRDFFASAERT